jgi:hypothetical protein
LREGQPSTERFNQEVVIDFAYDERELRRMGISEHFLKPAHFSTTTGEWTYPESCVVDTEGDRVVMQIDDFTDFALTGAPGALLAIAGRLALLPPTIPLMGAASVCKCRTVLPVGSVG